MNGYDNGNSVLYVLYKIVNVDSDRDDVLFNAFTMPKISRGPSLAKVKQNCVALHGLNHLGPDGYHWRVCVEDKLAPGETSASSSRASTYSWWDVQDENASLPMKTASPNDLHKFFSNSSASNNNYSSSSEASVGEDVAKVAKGALKSLGKAVTQVVVGQDGSNDAGPMVSVIAFKLLDLVKMHDDFSHKNHGRGGHIPQMMTASTTPPPPPPPTVPSRQRSQHSQSLPSTHSTSTKQHPPPTPHQHPQQRQQPPPQSKMQPRPETSTLPAANRNDSAPRSPEASLMDFGGGSSATATHSVRAGVNGMHQAARHGGSSSANNNITNNNPNETRAERLKREYAMKKHSSSRVWDDVDQRWVEVDPNANGNLKSTQSAPPGAEAINMSKKKEVGIALDPTSAVGKSSNVQAAVHARVTEMRQSQAKAVNEVREREANKKSQEAEEDLVRKKLEPKLKAWSEEHGKKKQLRALLATLHTILWPGADWKPVGIGDLLDDSKVKRCFHKASRVVHPDKTVSLGPEERFMAKRIFDALSQAKNDFDNGTK